VDSGLLLRAATVSLERHGSSSYAVLYGGAFLTVYLLDPARAPHLLGVIRGGGAEGGDAFDAARLVRALRPALVPHADLSEEVATATCEALSVLFYTDW
jgi:hypothetical protein